MSYADVNGVRMYYEEHGSGQPLILLHGGLGSGDMYGPILPTLARDRRVITADLQAHGHTADADRPLRHELLADDVAGLIRHLGLAQADVVFLHLTRTSRVCAPAHLTRGGDRDAAIVSGPGPRQRRDDGGRSLR